MSVVFAWWNTTPQATNDGLSFHPRHCRLKVVKGMLPCLLVLQACRRPGAHHVPKSQRSRNARTYVCVSVFSSVCACSSHLHWGMPSKEQKLVRRQRQ